MELHLYRIAASDVSFQNLVCQGIFQFRLYCAAKRPCTVFTVVTGFSEIIFHRICDLKLNIHLFPAPQLQIFQEKGDDPADMLFVQRMEYHDLINSVKELRPEQRLTSSITLDFILS